MMLWWQPCSPACLGSFLAVQQTRLQPSRDAPLSLNHCAAFSTNVRGKVIGDLEMHSSLFSQCCLFPGSVCSQAEFTLEVSAWTCSDQHLKQTMFLVKHEIGKRRMWFELISPERNLFPGGCRKSKSGLVPHSHTLTHISPCAQQSTWQHELCSLQQKGIILMKILPAGFNADVRNSTKD